MPEDEGNTSIGEWTGCGEGITECWFGPGPEDAVVWAGLLAVEITALVVVAVVVVVVDVINVVEVTAAGATNCVIGWVPITSISGSLKLVESLMLLLLTLLFCMIARFTLIIYSQWAS